MADIILEIVEELRKAGWVDIIGNWNPQPWNNNTLHTNELIGLRHPTKPFGLSVKGKRAFFQANSKKDWTMPVVGKTYKTNLQHPLRWYNIGPSSSWILDKDNKLIMNKTQTIAVAYG